MGVLEHVGDAVGGVVGVDGEVGGAGLEDGEDGDDEVGGAGQGEGDVLFGSDALVGEVVRECVGAGVQLFVGQGVRAVLDGDGPRCPDDLRLEELGEGGLRDVAGGVVPACRISCRSSGRGRRPG